MCTWAAAGQTVRGDGCFYLKSAVVSGGEFIYMGGLCVTRCYETAPGGATPDLMQFQRDSSTSLLLFRRSEAPDVVAPLLRMSKLSA
jgi:hypothetical protein